MNKIMTTTMIAIGAGMAAYTVASRNNMMSARNMKRMTKKVRRAIF
ncbi:YrzQ family protein [Neobacillus sp. BF23-41]